MAVIHSPRVDSASGFTPNASPTTLAANFAKAEGLTELEATELMAWLESAGYASIELVREASCCSVRWEK